MSNILLVILDGLTTFFLIIGYSYYKIWNPDVRVIVVPILIFNESESDDRFTCRTVLHGHVTGSKADDARIGCRCALAAIVFDAFSW